MTTIAVLGGLESLTHTKFYTAEDHAYMGAAGAYFAQSGVDIMIGGILPQGPIDTLARAYRNHGGNRIVVATPRELATKQYPLNYRTPEVEEHVYLEGQLNRPVGRVIYMLKHCQAVFGLIGGVGTNFQVELALEAMEAQEIDHDLHFSARAVVLADPRPNGVNDAYRNHLQAQAHGGKSCPGSIDRTLYFSRDVAEGMDWLRQRHNLRFKAPAPAEAHAA